MNDKEVLAEIQAELEDLWMNDPPQFEDEDSVVEEADEPLHSETDPE